MLCTTVPTPTRPSTVETNVPSIVMPENQNAVTTTASRTPWITPITSPNRKILRPFFITAGFFASRNAPMATNTTWLSARSTTTGGKPASRKPSVAPSSTVSATAGEMNMAMKIATWLPSVKLMGPSGIFTGEIIGINMAMAHSSAATHIL